MASNITERQYSGADAQLSEPHFDEEATLLSARPVVPIHEVKAEKRSGRRLVLGLGLVAAVMVGALAATLVYRQLQSPATATVDAATPVSNETAPEVSATTQADGGTADVPASGSIGVENVSEAATREVRKSSDSRPLRPAAAGVKRTDSRWTTNANQNEADTNQAGDVQTDDQWAERRAERQEARRLRREAERQARRDARKGRQSNDLLRIREIFEGSPRP